MSNKIRTSLRFTQLSDGNLSGFASGVIEGLTKEAAFSNPPVAVVDLTALRDSYDAALAAKAQGGKANTAAKNAARAALINALRKNALYVEIASDNNLALLLSSGYLVVNTNRAQSVLDKVQIDKVEHAQTGELKVRVRPLTNARSFEGRIKASNGTEFGPSISFASSRAILFKGLTAGVTYTLQLCGIGGSTGRGDWSDPSSHMAM